MAQNIIRKMSTSSRAGATFLGLVLASVLAQPLPGRAEAVSPEAQQLLRASTDYLAAQQRFSLETASTIEVVLESGQKIQFDHGVRLSVQRPNKLRAERTGDLVDQVFFYDGKVLTLLNPDDNVYATIPAPSTIEDMLDFARDSLDIVAPAGDLVFKNAYDILMQDVTSGFVVGKSVVEGVRSNHLAFRAPHVDWQIWIEEGDRPLPRKLVITTRDIVNAPQFTVVVKNWNLEPCFSKDMFSYTPPQAPQRVDFILKGAAGGQQ